MGFADNTHKAAVDGLVARGGGATLWVSVHTGAAGTTGANEHGDTDSYDRQEATFGTGSMSGGVWVRTGSEVSVPVGDGTYPEAGLWTAQNGGDFVASSAFVGGSIVVGGTGGTIDITAVVSA